MKKKVMTTFATAAILSAVYAGSASANTYSVQKGDYLGMIAKKYNTTVLELKKLNHLSSDLIYVTQILNIPSTTTSNNTAANFKTLTVASQPASVTYYAVKGDCLTKIANKYGVTLGELKLWNNLKSDKIAIGQSFKIITKTAITIKGPVPATKAPAKAPAASTAKAPAPTTKVPSVPANASKTPAPPSTGNTAAQYIVKAGDTLSKISTLVGMTVDEIKKANNLSTDRIYIGQKLNVAKTPAGLATPEGGTAGTVPAGQAPTPTPASTTDLSASVVMTAKQVLGIPYVWGGSSIGGFDCSGFIYYVFNKAGKSITRTSADGYFNRSYYVNNPKPGDLVFFENTYKKGISHMGIYLGGNQFIHASDNGVAITNLNNSYYKSHLDSFKRFY
ncbi:LysM peptidoglycan-binding domain-containing protein [Neobacillus terrae]|uniref:C40 family peptidase n=1 Tax=Neobacillus terrae TaxID=3034837 RepID=UPI001408B886|nr:C40 family peptidase [Neobacillus terrae]NHM30032.1 LysM peptidoglycan-binding domain-containing protein [Neobacillus terrae]